MKHCLWAIPLFIAGTALAQTPAWVNEPGGVSIAVDAADNVYTARWDYAPAGDIYLAKRDANGTLLWETRFDNTDTTRHEVATWVETDAAGNILVSGTLRSGFSSPVNANSLLMKFAPDGRLLWRRVYDGNFDGSSTRKLLVDSDNSILVLGLGTGPAGQVSTIRKFDAEGNTVWAWFDDRGIGAPVNLKWTPDAALLLSARGITGSINGYAKINRNGQTLFSLPAINSLTVGDAAGDSSGNSYLINGDYPGNAGSVLRKIDPSGNTLWQRLHPMAGFRVEVGPDQAPVISGFPNAGTAGAAFAKHDATGTLLWSQLDADGPAVASLSHAQMKLDTAGHAYLAASTLFEMAVTKVNANGSIGWTALMPGSAAYALAFGAQQRVYVTGGLTARIDQQPVNPGAIDLAVTLTDAPDPVRAGANLVYTATVRNLGNISATLARLTTSLPRNVMFVSSIPTQGSCSGTRPMSCTLGTLAAGASATVRVTVKPLIRGTLTMSASASATETDPVPANNAATATTSVVAR